MICGWIFSALIAIALALCPDVKTKPDFDLTKYVGDWYEIQRIDAAFQFDAQCVRARYAALEEPGTFSVLNTGIMGDGIYLSITGVGTQTNESAPASLTVQFPQLPPGSYLVLDTDYTTFATVYSCEVAYGQKIEQGWLLSRNNTLPQDQIDRVMNDFTDLGVNISQFQKYYQGEDCEYDAPLALCPDVKTKPDFDLSEYVGDWYEIQRIDNAFQFDAECVRARYAALDGIFGYDRSLLWDYEGETGPDNWDEIDPMCGGSEQSPINIVTSSAVAARYDPIFVVNGETVSKKVTVANNGHTVVVSMEVERVPYVFDESLEATFNFEQAHFHWGSNDSHGSEHAIDNERFSAEIHLVHWNTKYGSFSDALQNYDGLLVLGVFVTESEDDNPNLGPIVDMLSEVRVAETNTTRANLGFRLNDLLPKDLGKFYRYRGSLTTPNCNEAVFWIVFSNPIVASVEQLSKFRELLKINGKSLVNNYRPFQNLGSRNIYVRSSAPALASTLISMVLCLFMSMYG